MTEIVVGCPVANRAWILPSWFAAVEEACEWALVTPTYVFVVPKSDTDTLDTIHDHRRATGREVLFDLTNEDPSLAQRNWWKQDRMRHMADLRNRLLALVRPIEPDIFWSLDSDMLSDVDALQFAVTALADYDAVGMRAFMTMTGTDHTSRGQIVNGRLRNRLDCVGTFQVDCIMAAKVLSPRAYAIDYVANDQGEDIGWSMAAAAAGLRLGWTSYATCRHVMTPSVLAWPDNRL
jgi:hypothetical protein